MGVEQPGEVLGNLWKRVCFQPRPVSQQVPRRSKSSQDGVSTLFALLHNAGIVWCGPLGRFLCPSELALCQGLDAYNKEDISTSFAVEGRDSNSDTCWKRARGAFAGQVGNSMCTAAVGSLWHPGAQLVNFAWFLLRFTGLHFVRKLITITASNLSGSSTILSEGRVYIKYKGFLKLNA